MACHEAVGDSGFFFLVNSPLHCCTADKAFFLLACEPFDHKGCAKVSA
jgi:hypothetical protein